VAHINHTCGHDLCGKFVACEEYRSMVKDKVAEAEWKYLDVNEHWQLMKSIMMGTAQVTCGLS